MRALRTVGLAVAVLTVTLAITECASQLLARASLRLTPHRARLERRAFLAAIPAAATRSTDGSPDAVHRRYVDMAYGARYELHPFFGHTFFRNYAWANNDGFVTDKAYPYTRAAREYVVGVFGGSVAMQIAARGEILAARLQPALRARGFDTVTVLPFAVGGWRQPQSFFALVYYLDSIDMAVVLDGFNEVVTLSPQQLRGYPARFPFREIFAPLASDTQSPYASAALGKLAMAHAAARRATVWLDRSPLGRSMTAHLVWRALAGRYVRYVTALRREVGAAAGDEWSSVEPDGDAERRIESYFKLYTSVIRYGAIIAAAERKPFFHFVQPNQHDRGSKPLSDEERALVTAPWLDVVSSRYRRLERASAELRADGVDSTFLGAMFASTPETVYADACCHFNARGVERIGNAIADHLLASGALGGGASDEAGGPTVAAH